jgi:hypothetical protein
MAFYSKSRGGGMGAETRQFSINRLINFIEKEERRTGGEDDSVSSVIKNNFHKV